MKWIQYLQRTPVTQIRVDWAEYIHLRRQCESLQNAKNAAYLRMVTVINGDTPAEHNQSCVRQHCYTGSQLHSNNCDDIVGNMVWVRYTACKKFVGHNSSLKCPKVDCPFIKVNHAFVDACERFNLMRQARRDFWRHKFAQACQNVK